MRGSVLALVVLAACAGGQTRRLRAPPPPGALLGTWAIADGSDVLMHIRAGDPPVIEALAAASKQRFEVSGVTWDGRRLVATFRYPPTGVTTTSELLLINRDRLAGTVHGAYTGRETWTRVE